MQRAAAWFLSLAILFGMVSFAAAGDKPCSPWAPVVLKGSMTDAKIVVPRNRSRPPYYVFTLLPSTIEVTQSHVDADRFLHALADREYAVSVEKNRVVLASSPLYAGEPFFVTGEVSACENSDGHVSVRRDAYAALVSLDVPRRAREWGKVYDEAMKLWQEHTGLPRIEIEEGKSK